MLDERRLTITMHVPYWENTWTNLYVNPRNTKIKLWATKLRPTGLQSSHLSTLIKKLWQFLLFLVSFIFVIKNYNVASHCCEKLLLVILVVQCYYYHLHMLCSHNLSVYYYYNAIKTVSPYIEPRYNVFGQNRLRQKKLTNL